MSRVIRVRPGESLVKGRAFEGILDRAKHGETRAVAVGYVRPEKHPSGPPVAHVAALQHRREPFIREALEDPGFRAEILEIAKANMLQDGSGITASGLRKIGSVARRAIQAEIDRRKLIDTGTLRRSTDFELRIVK